MDFSSSPLPRLLENFNLEQHLLEIPCEPPQSFTLNSVDGDVIDELINYARQESCSISRLTQGRSMCYLLALIKNASTVSSMKEMIEITDRYIRATGTRLHPRHVDSFSTALQERFPSETVDDPEIGFSKFINTYLFRR